jgi:hypothetical protein
VQRLSGGRSCPCWGWQTPAGWRPSTIANCDSASATDRGTKPPTARGRRRGGGRSGDVKARTPAAGVGVGKARRSTADGRRGGGGCGGGGSGARPRVSSRYLEGLGRQGGVESSSGKTGTTLSLTTKQAFLNSD